MAYGTREQDRPPIIHPAYALAVATVVLCAAALTSWVLINWLVGCGEIDPYTRTANIEVCFMHPANYPWR